MSARAIDLAIAQFECKCHALIQDLKVAANEYDGDELVQVIDAIGQKYGMIL